MKKTNFNKLMLLTISLSAIMMLSSCGISSGLVNQITTYGSQTNVVLQESNFKVIGQVSGSASDTYFICFGGIKPDLVAKAKEDMFSKADLTGNSRAIIHMSLSTHRVKFPFVGKRTVTVTGTVIEFTK